MAIVKPFRALRYNPAVIGADINDVVCPPYDVIGPEAQSNYLHRSEYNVVRLELGETRPSDSHDNNRYTRAAATLQDWQEQEILITEPDPAYYLYEEEFRLNGQLLRRKELMAITRLEDLHAGIIIPHEATIPPIVADRQKLLQATRTNTSPIFCLYQDPAHKVEKAYAVAFAQRENLPLYEFTDDFGSIHRLWRITGTKILTAIQKAFADKKLYIADGHHRYTAALTYRDALRAEGISTEDGPENYILMGLTALEDPGLTILPIHRLVRGLTQEQLTQLDEALPAYFGLEETDIEGEENPADFITEIIERINIIGNEGDISRHVFGMYGTDQNTFTTLSLKSIEAAWELMPDHSEAWQKLDASIFQTVILDGCLGLTPENLASGEYITYTRDAAEALARVQSGEIQRAFFLPATPVHEMIAVADAHDRMPAKSTFFYPKFTTGLVMRSL